MIEDGLDLEPVHHQSPDLKATRAVAEKLDKLIRDADAKAWASAGVLSQLDKAVVKWSNESHELAQTAYRNLPLHRKKGWDEAYEDEEFSVAETQLQKAGVRLAEIIKEALQ